MQASETKRLREKDCARATKQHALASASEARSGGVRVSGAISIDFVGKRRPPCIALRLSSERDGERERETHTRAHAVPETIRGRRAKWVF